MKRLKKFGLWTMILLATSIVLAIAFSPYNTQENGRKAVVATIDIDAPPEEVFAYLGNSANAHDWSVFVDHIVPLNADSFSDGIVGSRRRCFQQADEKGIQWDELITVVEKDKRRQLTIYNMQEFPMMADGLVTEQVYTPLENGTRCRLSFSLFFSDSDPGLWTTFKTYLAAYKIKSVFVQNMGNIKRIVEQNHETRP